MFDLQMGIAVVLLLAVSLGAVTFSLTRGWSRRRVELAAVVPLLVVAVDLVWLRDDIRLTWLLPLSNLVVVGNLVPLCLGVIGGLILRRFHGSRVRCLLWSAGLTGLAVLTTIEPLLGSPPQCRDDWRDGFCMQTTEFTCSPAAACTMMAAHDIRVDESTMARDCLTRETTGLAALGLASATPRASGTTWRGLYRGLSRHARSTRWQVVARRATVDDLVEHDGGPLILFVELRDGDNVDSRYAEEWGWVPGRRHTVVFYEFTSPDRIRIGDPSIGIEEWSRRDLEVLWQGDLFELIPRE